MQYELLAGRLLRELVAKGVYVGVLQRRDTYRDSHTNNTDTIISDGHLAQSLNMFVRS